MDVAQMDVATNNEDIICGRAHRRNTFFHCTVFLRPVKRITVTGLT